MSREKAVLLHQVYSTTECTPPRCTTPLLSVFFHGVLLYRVYSSKCTPPSVFHQVYSPTKCTPPRTPPPGILHHQVYYSTKCTPPPSVLHRVYSTKCIPSSILHRVYSTEFTPPSMCLPYVCIFHVSSQNNHFKMTVSRLRATVQGQLSQRNFFVNGQPSLSRDAVYCIRSPYVII